MVLVLRHCQHILSVKTTLYLIPSLLWLVLIHVELRNCPIPGTTTVGLLPHVLCSVSHLIYLWLKFPIIIPSPLLTVERGSSVVECRTRNQVSPGSNPALLPCRILGIFVLSIDAPVDSAV